MGQFRLEWHSCGGKFEIQASQAGSFSQKFENFLPGLPGFLISRRRGVIPVGNTLLKGHRKILNKMPIPLEIKFYIVWVNNPILVNPNPLRPFPTVTVKILSEIYQ